MMTDKDLTDRELDRLLHDARTDRIEPDAAWMARVAEDAVRETAWRAAPKRQTTESLWNQIRSALGGWPAMGGIVAACAAGIWIGVSAPEVLETPVSAALGESDRVDFISDSTFDYVAVLEEG